MESIKSFEKKAIRLLVKDKIPQEVLHLVFGEPTQTKYDYTGSGYFLSLHHPDLPSERSVYTEPKVIGEANGISSGFIVFVENSELTLECHSWGEIDIPENYRNLNVKVTAT